MKKFFVFLPILVASFFLLLPNVRAYTSNIDLSLIDEDFYTFKSCLDNSTNNPYYFIFYTSGELTAMVFDFTSHPEYINSSYMSFGSSSPYRFYVGGNITIGNYSFSSNTCVFNYNGNGSNVSFYSPKIILYSSFSPEIQGTLIYNYNNQTWDSSIVGTPYFLSVYDIYNIINSPTNKDNTPILTNFYSVVGSKVGWLGEQIVSNYIYLAIIGVFILIFIIDLIRRYFL